jgi:hypothetical protein
MIMMIERNTAQQMEEETKESKEMKETMRVTQLMSVFKEAKKAMGGPIKAAYQCPAFVRFLDKAERREFNRYKAEQEAKVSDDEGLPVFSFVTPNIRYLDNIYLNEKTENNTPIHKWS